MGLILVLTSQGCPVVMHLKGLVQMSQLCQCWLPFSFLPFSRASPPNSYRLCSWLCPGVAPAPNCPFLSRLQFGLTHHHGASSGQGSNRYSSWPGCPGDNQSHLAPRRGGLLGLVWDCGRFCIVLPPQAVPLAGRLHLALLRPEAEPQPRSPGLSRGPHVPRPPLS